MKIILLIFVLSSLSLAQTTLEQVRGEALALRLKVLTSKMAAIEDYYEGDEMMTPLLAYLGVPIMGAMGGGLGASIAAKGLTRDAIATRNRITDRAVGIGAAVGLGVGYFTRNLRYSPAYVEMQDQLRVQDNPQVAIKIYEGLVDESIAVLSQIRAGFPSEK